MDALDGQQTSTSVRERVPIPRVNRRSKRPPSLSKNMGGEESKFAVDPSLNDDALQRTQQHYAGAGPSQPSPNANGSVHKSVHEQQSHHPYTNHHSPSHPILGINHYSHPYVPQGSSYPLGPPSWSLPSLAHSLPDSPGPHAAHVAEAHSSSSPGAFRAADEPAASGSGARSTSPSMAPAEAMGRGAVRLPPILQVEKQHVTTTATQAASASRRRNDAIFKCPVPGCGSTFTRRFNLRGHLRSHTEERPFVCSWPGCGKGFARSHDCKRHQALHTAKSGSHECIGCGKKFSRQDALNRHLKSDAAMLCREFLSAHHTISHEGSQAATGSGPHSRSASAEAHMGRQAPTPVVA